MSIKNPAVIAAWLYFCLALVDIASASTCSAVSVFDGSSCTAKCKTLSNDAGQSCGSDSYSSASYSTSNGVASCICNPCNAYACTGGGSPSPPSYTPPPPPPSPPSTCSAVYVFDGSSCTAKCKTLSNAAGQSCGSDSYSSASYSTSNGVASCICNPCNAYACTGGGSSTSDDDENDGYSNGRATQGRTTQGRTTKRTTVTTTYHPQFTCSCDSGYSGDTCADYESSSLDSVSKAASGLIAGVVIACIVIFVCIPILCCVYCGMCVANAGAGGRNQGRNQYNNQAANMTMPAGVVARAEQQQGHETLIQPHGYVGPPPAVAAYPPPAAAAYPPPAVAAYPPPAFCLGGGYDSRA
jgi:hypothetical protein